MPDDPTNEEERVPSEAVTFADVSLQALVLACVIDKAPTTVPLEELAVLLFEGHFSPEEETQALRAAGWLVKVRLLERTGDELSPASPPAGLARLP
jgi:hypothetical protein